MVDEEGLDPPDNVRQLLLRTRNCVLISRQHVCPQQPLAAEEAKRKVTVGAVIAMEEATFLSTVQRIVRRVY